MQSMAPSRPSDSPPERRWAGRRGPQPARAATRAGLSFSLLGPLLALLALAAAASAVPVWAAAGFSQVGSRRGFHSVAGAYEWRFESVRGPSPFDRIGLHRLASKAVADHPQAVMLYLPGMNMNGELPLDDPDHVLTLYLASMGIDSWALDYRTHFIPPDTPAARLGELKNWTDELFVSDIDAAVKFILRQAPGRKIFVAGFSRGATFAYLYAAAHPQRVAGLVILDGFASKPPAPARAAREAPHRAVERHASDLGGRKLSYDKRRALLEMVIANPQGPAPIAKYKTARENLEHVVYDSAAFGGHGGLANPQGGFSDPVVLAHVMLLYDRYWPTVQSRENPLSAPLRAALRRSRIPVLAFASTNIAPQWPSWVGAAALLTGSTDVSVKELPGWGHLDVLCGTRAKSEVYAPMAAWLKRRVN